MMTIDSRRMSAVRAAARTPDEIMGSADPGVLSGVLSEVPRGVGRGLAAVQGLGAGLAEDVAQPLYDAMESATGVRPLNPFGVLRRASDETVRQMAPDPLTVGAAGQVVNSVATIATEVAAGAGLTLATGGATVPNLMWGAAGISGAASGRTTFQEMIAKGVDPSTAANAGFIDALTVGGGVLVPAAIGYQSLAAPLAASGVGLSRGAYYGANVAYGAAANMAMGVAQRASTYGMLKGAGYDAMADQYRPLEASALAAEGLLGGIFSAVGARSGLPMRAQPVVDAGLATRDAKHAALDSAPGIPTDPDTAVAHSRALEESIRALVEGRPVDVAETGVIDGQYIPPVRDVTAADVARTAYSQELVPADRYLPSTRLSDLSADQRTRLSYDAPELNEYAAHVEQIYGLPAGLINALKNAGERSSSTQVSPAGARGVMQFMPENLAKYQVTDPSDPVQMLDAAGRYLQDTMRQYGGNIDAVIADYNGGPRQARWVMRGEAPAAKETRDYLARVKGWLGDGKWSSGPGLDDSRPPAGRGRLQDLGGGAVPLEPVQIVMPEFAAGSMADILPRIREFARENFAGKTVVNEVDGSEITIPWQGIKHSLAGTVSRAVAAAALRIEDVIRRAEPVWSGPDRAGRQNVRAAHFYDVPIEVDGAPAEIRVVVRESNTGKRYYDHFELRKSESPAPGDQGSIQEGGGASVSHGDRENVPQIDQAGNGPGVELPLRSSGTQATGRSVVAVEAPDGAPVESSVRPDTGGQEKGASVVDPETRAGLKLLGEQGDISVPIEGENGEVINVSLREALVEADVELQYGRLEAFNAAVTCAMTRGS